MVVFHNSLFGCVQHIIFSFSFYESYCLINYLKILKRLELFLACFYTVYAIRYHIYVYSNYICHTYLFFHGNYTCDDYDRLFCGSHTYDVYDRLFRGSHTYDVYDRLFCGSHTYDVYDRFSCGSRKNGYSRNFPSSS
jgi:hypothetical protein